MSYLKHLSRDRLELDAADAVICVDSKELPCHLVLLSCISPVLASSAGLEGTRPRDDGRRVITFTKSLHTAEIFLEWAYCRGPMNLTATEAMDLAIVSHTWDIPGLADLCDRALVQCVAVSPNFFSTTKPTGQEPNLSLLEWAALAGKCELQSFAPCCEAYIINHFPLLATNVKLVDLSSQSLLRIMIGVYSRVGHGTTGLYCPSCPGTASHSYRSDNSSRYNCNMCSKQLREDPTSDYKKKVLRLPTLDDLKEWATVIELQRLHGQG